MKKDADKEWTTADEVRFLRDLPKLMAERQEDIGGLPPTAEEDHKHYCQYLKAMESRTNWQAVDWREVRRHAQRHRFISEAAVKRGVKGYYPALMQGIQNIGCQLRLI